MSRTLFPGWQGILLGQSDSFARGSANAMRWLIPAGCSNETHTRDFYQPNFTLKLRKSRSLDGFLLVNLHQVLIGNLLLSPGFFEHWQELFQNLGFCFEMASILFRLQMFQLLPANLTTKETGLVVVSG